MISYTITLKDYIAAQKLHTGIKGRLFRGVVFIISLLVIYFLIFRNGINTEFPGVLLPLLFPAVGIFAIMSYSELKNFKRTYDAQKALHEDLSFEFDSSEFSITTKTGSYESKWADLFQYKIGGQVILLYDKKNIVRILPVGKIKESGEYENLITVLKGQGENIQ